MEMARESHGCVPFPHGSVPVPPCGDVPALGTQPLPCQSGSYFPTPTVPGLRLFQDFGFVECLHAIKSSPHLSDVWIDKYCKVHGRASSHVRMAWPSWSNDPAAFGHCAPTGWMLQAAGC